TILVEKASRASASATPMPANPPVIPVSVDSADAPSEPAESSAEAPSYAGRQRLALTMLAGAVGGIVVTAYFQERLPERWWLEFLLHAFGARWSAACATGS